MMRRRGGLVRAAATTAVVAGTAGAVSHHQQQKYASQAEAQAYEQQQAAAAAAPPPPQYAPPPAAPAEDPQMAQLQKLAELHTQGILSDEEFAAAKAKALGIWPDPLRDSRRRGSGLASAGAGPASFHVRRSAGSAGGAPVAVLVGAANPSRPGRSEGLDGLVSMTRRTVRQTAATTPRNGTTRNMPTIPAISAPAGMAARTTAGCRLTTRLYTSGATMLPATMLNTIVKMAMIAMSCGVPVATVTRNARPVVMQRPDVRDEPAEERKDGERQRVRDAQDGHDQELGGRTEDRDGAGPDHVAAEHVERPGFRPHRLRLRRARLDHDRGTIARTRHRRAGSRRSGGSPGGARCRGWRGSTARSRSSRGCRRRTSGPG